jgi:hypothetical protein
MSEAELAIKERHEAIYNPIKRLDPEDSAWEGILEDLESLNWLVEGSNVSDLISAVWSIAGKNACEALEGRSRFRVFKLSRVKIFVTTVAHNITNMREDVRDICSVCKKLISDFSFFTEANVLLTASTDVADDFIKVVDVYEDAKRQITSSLIHLDKSYSIEMGKSISKALDETFYQRVVSPNKTVLAETASIASLLSKYSPSAARTTTYQTGFYPNYSYTSYQRDSVYLGELDQDNKREGFGKCSYYNGDDYEGFWVEDRPHGRGVYYWKDGGRYEGDFVDGRMHGEGKRTFASGAVYQGGFDAGKKHGSGTILFKNGDSYVGGWDFDDMSGEGVYTWHTGDKFTGKFRRDKREGPGVLSLESGEEIRGEWLDGKMKQPTSL